MTSHPPPLPHAGPPPAVLAYSNPDTPAPPSRALPLLFACLLLPAAVVPWVSFTFGVSPWSVLREFVGRQLLGGERIEVGLILLATPFVGALPLLAWHALLAARAGRANTMFRAAGWFFAALFSLIPLGTCGWAAYIIADEGVEFTMWPFPAGFAVLAVFWTLALVFALRRRHRRPDDAVTLALAAGYLANATFCLGGFYSDPEPGYWLTAWTAAALLAEAIVILVRPRAVG